MASEESVFRHGAAVFPPPSALTNSLLRDVDPGVFYVLAFYESVLNTYLGTRFAAQALAAGVTSNGAAITTTVAYTLPDNPTDYLTEHQVKFPLLAVYRVRSTRRDRTVTWRQNVGQWKVAYVLPPLTAGQREQLIPILRAVENVLDNRTELGYDAAYLSGAKILASSYANLETIEVKDAEYTAWEAGRDLVFPAIVLTLEVKERGAPISDAYDPLGDVDTNLDNAGTGETTMSDVVQTRTDTSP